jgi:peptidyl-prolyl cis-trans isomerase C
MKKGIISLFLLLVLTLAGPLRAETKKAKTTSSKEKNPVLARLDKEVITVEDYKAALETLPPQLQWAVHQNKDLRAKFLDNIVKKRLLVKAAKAKGIKEDQEMRRKIAQFKDELILDQYLKEELKNTKVTDKEVQEYYQNHKEEFKTEKQVRARHILLKEEAHAQKILKELQKGGDFPQLAKKYSVDKATAEKGGELGFFTQKDMVKPFADAAFSLKPGQLSPVVKTPFGYHIIQVEEVKPAEQKSFNEVKAEIKSQLLQEKQQEAFNRLIAQIEKKWKVETYPDRLDQVFKEKGPTPK